MKGPLASSLLLATCLSIHASQSPASTETDSAKVIRLTTALEERPLDPAAPEMRAWLVQWAEAIPDVSILVCGILEPVLETHPPYGPELLVQYMFGNGSFQVQHPDNRDDMLKTQMAGVTSMLAAYHSILQEYPGAHIPYLDSWMDKQAAGTLDDYLVPIIESKCQDAPPKA